MGTMLWLNLLLLLIQYIGLGGACGQNSLVAFDFRKCMWHYALATIILLQILFY